MSTTGNKKGQSGSDRGDEMDGSWFIDGDTYSPPSSPSHRQQTRSEPRDEGINPSFTATTSLFCCAQCPLPRSEKGDYFHTFLTALHSVPTNSRSANLFPKFPLLSAKQKDTAPFGRVIEVVTMSPAAMTPQRKYQSYYYVSRSGARGDCKFREVAESDVERWVYGDETIETPIASIITELKSLDDMQSDFQLANGIFFDNHPNALSDTGEEVSQRLEGLLWAKLSCFFMSSLMIPGQSKVHKAYSFTLASSLVDRNLDPLSIDAINSLLQHKSAYLTSGKPPVEPTFEGLMSAIECCVKTTAHHSCLYSGAGEGAKADIDHDEEVNGIICRVRTADKLDKHVHWRTAAWRTWWENVWDWRVNRTV
ncbi:hypothetical protein BJ875DRAFT_497738 [Amylocarpus encephaloides]|uniref:Uncharacterized protein n=1 Tax=Amylocarpus encephaloides TaxID=45428 RepID=A0A9P8C3I2_9HELO|nr:hypothetical protein BJ875DRAFT_497738 [Amylocarpus encephaloides]